MKLECSCSDTFIATTLQLISVIVDHQRINREDKNHQKCHKIFMKWLDVEFYIYIYIYI